MRTKQETARIELKSTDAQQDKVIDVLMAQLKGQAAQIQKATAELAAAGPSLPDAK
jgi:uncharacterized coiled-coil protein SlyX